MAKDTGLDLDHPAFKDQQGKSRVVASYDLVGDAFNGSNTPVPGQDTVDDCAGHGTHVAGIAAAAGDLPGVAPEASLGVYRVFGCTGSTSSVRIPTTRAEDSMRRGTMLMAPQPIPQPHHDNR